MTLSFTPGESVSEYLHRYERNELLRFLTCGSVDDGKSTLIGRLLHDTGRLYDDHLKAIEAESKVHGTQGGALDLALVVDGLKAEREQGITIDVAYRYFATAHRSFIIADCPGHEQYTRNMATGASHCQLAITLIDARSGVTTQTRRHAFIASLLGICHVVAAVNKMDLVAWGEGRFREIESEFLDYCVKVGIAGPIAVPVSALTGENVVTRGANAAWYSGAPILELLEKVRVEHASPVAPFRMPVQYVIRPSLDFRGFAGTIASGTVKAGDRVRIMPSGRETRVRRIARSTEDGGDLSLARAPQSVVITFEDEVDCSRGDVVSCFGGSTETLVAQKFECDLVWMDETPLTAGKTYLLKCGTRTTPARITRVRHCVNVDTLEVQQTDSLALNDIGRIEIETEQPIAFDPYRRIHGTGSVILIDRMTNATSAAGMIRTGDASDAHARRAHWETAAAPTLRAPVGQSLVSTAAREARWKQKPLAILLYGSSGSGKTTRAFELERGLWEKGHAVVVLDGQMLRAGLSRDLAFTEEERSENLRRASETARILLDQGFVVILSMVAPHAEARWRASDLIGSERFMMIDCSDNNSPDTAALLRMVTAKIG